MTSNTDASGIEHTTQAKGQSAEDVALLAASQTQLTVDASIYDQEELVTIVSAASQKTIVDIVNADDLSDEAKAHILQSAGGNVNFV